MKRHDHRNSVWLIAGGRLEWCYRCGAYRVNEKGWPWHRPTGPDGDNPAMRPGYSFQPRGAHSSDAAP